MFENTSLVSSECCSWFLHVCVVIADYHDHITTGWWKLKHGGQGWEVLAKFPGLIYSFIF